MHLISKLSKCFLACTLCATSLFMSNISLQAVEEIFDVNFALNKPVTASAAYATLPASNLTDTDKESRWSTEMGPVQWAYIDLQEERTVNHYSVIWENDSVYAEDYKIYVSNDVNNWGTPVVDKQGNTSKTSSDVFNKVSGRYVKLEVTKQKGYPSVSARNFEIMLKDGKPAQDPNENVALNKTAFASSQEADSVRPQLAVDGNNSAHNSRWGSAVKNAPHWIAVDLAETKKIKTIKVFWELRKATKYRIQVANTSNTPSEGDWQDAKVINNRPTSLNDVIVLDEVVNARYIRLYIDSSTAEDPDGGVTWNAVSIYELEVYGGETKESMDDIINKIAVVSPSKGATKLEVSIPSTLDYEITYNGTDYEQIIDKDLTIYQPIVDTTVKVSFKIVDKKNKDNYKFKEIDVVVLGQYQKEANDNAAPVILPELREWKGMQGVFVASDNAKVWYADPSLKDTAQAMATDYQLICNKTLEVVEGNANQASAGDFVLTLTNDKSKGLQKEGYLMNVSDKVVVEAETSTGAYWATRTILQSIKTSGNVPCGIARDYPLYAVRGFILDVGRKTFTLDYLQQVVQQMSWYKLNDFQIHLNDNLIPIENLEDPMSAQSAFRLESDIKKGGNNGLNQADLTSKDVFYTKEEFKDLIQESRTYGVDIVPEIDTPAHSLALTKVRPDLRHGTNGRENDHLALRDKYDECLTFVKSIFNEYMGSDLSDPVFDDQTVVHVGADEYNADKEAYRRFADDMLKYVQDSGRVARIWGSLSQCVGNTPVRSQDVQMNLWNFGYANMDKMYELGYDLINCNDGNYYIVPNAGYYYDYLNDNTLYNLPINSIGGVTIPAGDEQMIGAAFAVWNDMTDYLDNGVSEHDVYDRLQNAIPLMGAKLWGKRDKTLAEANEIRGLTGDAPQTNFNYDVKKTMVKLLIIQWMISKMQLTIDKI